MSEPGSAKTQAAWETIAAQARTVEARALETEGGPDLAATMLPAPSPAPAGDRLEHLLARMDGGRGRVEVHEEFARGGMGVLRRARQRAVGRDVALKSVRPDRVGAQATRKLLDEAWITGRLEHPNIVPVYDVELVRGEPHVLMQRIDGRSWLSLLDDAETVASRFAAPDLLEWNLQTLMQVATAVHYAHSRHVLHLDIKPENVMVGDYGQVYLLDWGVAVLMDAADDSLALPRATAREGIVGTPIYMAPEMVEAAADGVSRLTPATDVYLLGATLFHVVAGEAPHAAPSLVAALHHAMFERPVRPSGIADELWSICVRAMDPDPGARFQTAEAFRQALAAFLRHRGSIRIADDATRELEAFERTLARRHDAPPSAQGASGVEPREIQSLYSAARFGFQQALAIWADNVAAKRGLTRTIEVMAEHELADGDPDSAASLITELESPPPALSSRIEAALEARRSEAARVSALTRLGSDFDLSAGQRTRWFVTMVFGLLATLIPIVSHTFDARGAAHRYEFYAGIPVFFLVVGLGIGIWARESMTRSKINLRYGVAVLAMLPAQLLVVAVLWAQGRPPDESVPIYFLIYMMTCGLLALLVELRALPGAIGYGVGYVLTSLDLGPPFLIMSACNAIMTINVVWMWWPERVFERRRRAPADEP